jgi:hypothetical protein
MTASFEFGRLMMPVNRTGSAARLACPELNTNAAMQHKQVGFMRIMITHLGVLDCHDHVKFRFCKYISRRANTWSLTIRLQHVRQRIASVLPEGEGW